MATKTAAPKRAATKKRARTRPPAKARAPKKAVHRDLHLVSPIVKGSDVRALQQSMKADLKKHEITWRPLKVDAALGNQTIDVAVFIARYVLGLSGKRCAAIKAGRITEKVQKLLRGTAEPSRADRARRKLRQPRLEEIRKKNTEGPKLAIAYAEACEGITENPAGSNTGPTTAVVVAGKTYKAGITFWEAYWNLGSCYWCLVFACYCLREIGGAQIPGPDEAVLCVNAAEIERQARAHINGFIVVPVSELRGGDLALWCFDGTGIPDHGELVRGPYRGHSNDIGGNTSDGAAGSQSNGGGVFGRPDRDLAQLTCGVRVLFA